MLLAAIVLLAGPPAPVTPPPADTLRLEVGSPEVDGRVFRPHAARVRVRVGTPDGPIRAEWTNALTVGDSAGRSVMRWITRGTRTEAAGALVNWEIHQTYDARTLAPYGYLSISSTGACTQLTIDGLQVRGMRRIAGDSAASPIVLDLDRAGFIASASDLVPLAAGLRDGVVMTAPVWGPNMARAESRIFAVVGRETVDVEGTAVESWKVEERRDTDGGLVAAWYLVEGSPYMVYGEVALADGRMQYMTEIAVPMPPEEPAPAACAG